MARENAEAAALVLGAHGGDILIVDHDGGRGGDQKPHGAALAALGLRVLVARVLNGADHVERAFGPRVAVAVEEWRGSP